MAKQPTERPIADRIDDLPTPAESLELFGHGATLTHLCNRYASGKMHHAWLLGGPRGIGKATLAFRFAAHIFRNPDPALAPDIYEIPTPNDVMESRVAGGGHPNLLHLTRPLGRKG